MTLRYILRNVSKYDIHFADLNGYVLPRNKSKDFFAPGMLLSLERINKSRESGTVKHYLDKKMVIEVLKELDPKAPLIKSDAPRFIKFPQRTKSSIIVEVNRTLDSEEEQKQIVISDEDKLLKEMEESDPFKDGEVPVARKNER